MKIPARGFLTATLCLAALSIVNSIPAQTGCVPVPAGLVGWWAGEGNANDSTGANNGVPEGGVTFVPGKVGQAFRFDGATADVDIPASASLNLGTGGGMTIELWINPVAVSTNEPLVEWNNGSFGVLLDIAVPVSVGGAGPGSFVGCFKDITLAAHVVNSPPGVLQTGVFQHLAVTYDKASGEGAAYLNGVLVGQVFLGDFTPMTLGDLYFGFRPFDAGAGMRYAGLMDEVSLYDRALSAAEIEAIYAAGSSGKCSLPPVIEVEPQSQTVPEGGTASFSVGAGGSPPLTYQWRVNGAEIPSPNGNSLVLTDVQLAEAGAYSVVVSNAAGLVVSSIATLTVSAQTGCAPAPAGLVGWWAGEGNANDSTGANPGLLEGEVTFVPGEAGEAFSFNGVDADVKIPATPSLDVGLGAGLTVEAWIRPAVLSLPLPIVEWNSGAGTVPYGVHFWTSVKPPEGAGPGCLYADLIDAGGGYHYFSSAANLLLTNGFQHVALTYDKASGVATIYLNGSVIALEYLGSFTPQTASDLYLGYRPAGIAAGSRYAGQMDEVSLYSRALSAAEVQAIYAAGSAGKCALPAVIAVEPQNETVAVGGTATFSVVAGGSPPLSYQWRLNGAEIPSPNGNSLVLTDVQLAEAGVYSVIVSNAEGAATSSDATLTVSARTGCVPVPAGLVGWWAGEGNANDNTGANPGALEGGVTFVPGEVGEAFSFNGVDADVRIPATSTLNVGLGAGLTVEAWLRPADIALARPIVEWNSGQGAVPYGVHFWTSEPSPFGAGPGCLYANVIDAEGGDHSFASAGSLLTTSAFQHVALTYNKLSGVGTIYLNGSVVAVKYLGGFTPQTSSDLYLGYRPAGAPAGTRFLGQEDEVSLYNRALSAAEIQAIYAAGSSGKCALAPVIAVEPQSQTVQVGGTLTFSVVASGSATLSYQWSFRGSNLVGATNASLTLTDVGLGAAGVYSVIVSDAGGAVTSSDATLTVSAQTGCAPVPAGLVGWWAGEGNANDSAGTDNGVLEGGVTFVPGEVGQAFSFDGTTADVRIPASATLNVGVGDGLTIETWIRPADLTEQRPLVEWNSGDLNNPYPYGVHFWTSVPPPWGPGAGCLFANIWDTLGGAHIIVSAGGLLTTSTFQHAALTYSKTTGLAVIYLNGAVVAQQELGTFTPLTTSDLYLGCRPAGVPVGQRFAGQMDEVSLYNRALSAAEIQTIYAAGSSGKCALPPAQSSYAAYAFTNLAGMPGISGSADGTGSAARFNGPPGVAVDGLGNIYVADATNETIRRVTSGGVVTTLAGLAGTPGSADGVGSAARFDTPVGVAVDSAGNVYVADWGASTIREVTPVGTNWVVRTLAGLANVSGSADGAGSSARFRQPAGLAVDSVGNVYVADYFNNTIRKVTPEGVATTLAGQAGQAGSADGTGSAARFYAPFAVAVDATGNLYVADQFNQTIRKLTPAGVVTTLAGQVMNAGSADGTGSAAQFYFPSGVAVDAMGNAYVGDQFNQTIRRIAPGGAVTTLGGLAGSSGSVDGIGNEARFDKPSGVAVDRAGYLYVADAWNNRITKGTPSALAQTACAPVPSGLVGWWRAEGNANDSAGTDEGIPEGGLAYAPGEVGQAFVFNGTDADVHIPASATLNVGAGGGMSVEAWIKPAEVTAQHPLVEWNGGSFGAELWLGVIPPLGTGPGCLYGALVDASRHPNAISSAGGLVVPNAWQHVALTYDKTTGIAVLYLDGAVVQQETLGVTTPLTTGDLWLGLRPYEPNDSAAGLRYAGLMDEVSIYNRALSAAEIQAIYAAGSSGKCGRSSVVAIEPHSQTVFAGANAAFSVPTVGLPPMSFQWTFDGANIAGATNATLILTNAQFDQGGTYSVALTTSTGYVTSTPATLIVLSPLQFSETGAYSVQITNLYGSVLSDSAALITSPAFAWPGLHPGLTISGAVGKTFRIQYATSLNATNTWTTITNLTLTQPVQSWVDPNVNVSGGTSRFYRVIVVP